MKVYNFDRDTFDKGKVEKFIQNRHTLAATTMAFPSKLAAAEKFKDRMQKRHPGIKKRKIFVSKNELCNAQQKIRPLLSQLFMDKADTYPILSYIKGKSYQEEIKRDCVDMDLEISFDIKKYYDNISSEMIQKSLRKMGFSFAASKMITKLCTVRMGNKFTLQQGSSVSPLISNIVGYYYLDVPIQKYLDQLREEHPRMKIVYKRFCDNIGVWIDGPMPAGISENIKEEVKKRVRPFLVHDWKTVSQEHPYLAQTFLGVVLNKQPKIDNYNYNKTKGILFNAATKNIYPQALQYFKEKGDDLYHYNEMPSVVINKFLEKIGGYVNYVKQINTVQGQRLEKLYEYCKTKNRAGIDRSLTDEMFNKVKRYNKDSESVEEFLAQFT